MHQSVSYVNTSYQEVQPTVGYIYMIIHRIELCFYIALVISSNLTEKKVCTF